MLKSAVVFCRFQAFKLQEWWIRNDIWMLRACYDTARCVAFLHSKRLTISQKGPLIIIPITITNGDWVRYFWPDKMDQTLPGFEPVTSQVDDFEVVIWYQCYFCESAKWFRGTKEVYHHGSKKRTKKQGIRTMSVPTIKVFILLILDYGIFFKITFLQYFTLSNIDLEVCLEIFI